MRNARRNLGGVWSPQSAFSGSHETLVFGCENACVHDYDYIRQNQESTTPPTLPIPLKIIHHYFFPLVDVVHGLVKKAPIAPSKVKKGVILRGKKLVVNSHKLGIYIIIRHRSDPWRSLGGSRGGVVDSWI